MPKVQPGGEIRIPTRLLSTALADKTTKALHLLAHAKLEGHRAEIASLYRKLRIHPKTGKRLIRKITAAGWAGTDGKFLFPRAWRKLSLNKRGGLYLAIVPQDAKRFEALCFAKALKKLYRRRGNRHSKKGRVTQTDFPARYISRFLGISDRRLVRLKAAAQKYRFMSVTRQFDRIGKVNDYATLRKNLPGLPVFRKGAYTVIPEISKIKICI
jgi:hypothetical protein